MPPANESELIAEPVDNNDHIVLDLDSKEPLLDSQGNYIDAQGQYKDGADLFGPKMQQLRMQLLNQHQEYQKLRRNSSSHTTATTVEVDSSSVPTPPSHKQEASLAKKGISLGVWFCFNSLTLILNKYAPNTHFLAMLFLILL